MNIYVNKHQWGWKNNLIYGWGQLADSLVRVLSFGLLTTTWVSMFVRDEGLKYLRNQIRRKS